MSVRLLVNNAYTSIEGLEDLPKIDLISRELSYKVGFITWSMKNSGWDGTYRLLTSKQNFPTGCLPRVKDLLDRMEVPFTVDDQRDWKEPKGGLAWTGYDLYDYQNSIVETCLDEKVGMVKAATGAGKTLIISKLAYEYNLPTVIYVVSTDLLQQMHQTLSESITAPIGMVGNGVCDIQNITVCSAWTAGRAYNKKIKKADDEVKPDNWTPSQEQRKDIREMVEHAELVVLDEAQFAAADSIKNILSNSKGAAHRFGFTGTPWRTDGDDILLEAAFGRRICDLPASELVRQGYLVPAHFVFKDIPKMAGLSNATWAGVKKQYIVENHVRNQILMKATLDLMEMGRKPLVLFREHKHGKLLRELIPEGVNYRYVTGKVDAKKRQAIREEFKAGEVDLILASTVYDQGIDLPALDALVLAGGGKSTAKALQRVGRVIRGNKEGGKKDAIIVDTFDQANYTRKHSYMRYLIYKTENEFKFKVRKDFESYINRMKRYGDKEGYIPH